MYTIEIWDFDPALHVALGTAGTTMLVTPRPEKPVKFYPDANVPKARRSKTQHRQEKSLGSTERGRFPTKRSVALLV